MPILANESGGDQDVAFSFNTNDAGLVLGRGDTVKTGFRGGVAAFETRFSNMLNYLHIGIRPGYNSDKG